MSNLLKLLVLGLALGVSSVSYAGEGINAFGVNLPIEQIEVKNEIKGEYSASHSEDTYNVFGVQLPLYERHTEETITEDSNTEYILVFGVKVPVNAG